MWLDGIKRFASRLGRVHRKSRALAESVSSREAVRHRIRYDLARRSLAEPALVAPRCPSLRDGRLDIHAAPNESKEAAPAAKRKRRSFAQ